MCRGEKIVSNKKSNKGLLGFIVWTFIISGAIHSVIADEVSILGMFVTFSVVLGVLLGLFILYVFGYNMIKNGRSFLDCVQSLPELLRWMFSSKVRDLNNQMAKDFKILSEACDPEEFILKVNEFLATGVAITHEFNCRWNIALAYYELGDTDKAIEMTEDLIQLYDNNKSIKQIIKKFYLYDQLVSFNLKAKENDKAKQYMDLRDEEMQRLSDTGRQNLEDGLFPYSKGAQFFNENRYEHALAYQEKVYAKNEELGNVTNLNKVGNHYQFAKIYEKLGNIEKEIEHLRLVVKHGNKLKKATDARHRLFELDVDVPVEDVKEIEEIVKEVVEAPPKQQSLIAYIVMLIMVVGVFVWLSSR